MRLGNAMLASTLGHGHARPLRAARFRLVLLLAGALLVAWLGAKTVYALPVATATAPELLIVPVILSIQVLVLGCLLSAQSLADRQITDTWGRWLQSLPVHPARQHVVRILPQLLLVLVCLTACGWPLGLYYSLAGLPIEYFAIGAVLGGMSALGLARWGERMPLGLWMIILACLLYAEYQWMRIITGTTASGSDRIVAHVSLCACLALSLLHTALPTSLSHRESQTTYRSRLPSSWWFVIKLFRSRSIMRGIILTGCMSLGSVLLCRRLGIFSPDIYGSLAALLGAAVAADMRMPMRRSRTPESQALKGSFYVVRTVFTGGLAASIVAVSPLLWALQEINATPLAYVPVVTGIIAGLSASIILAPASRDISSQCSASLLALGLIAGIPQLVPATASRLSAYGILLAILIPIACIAEYKRNPYYWRTYA